MKILVQWARAQESHWEEFDSSQWARLPKRARPDRQDPDGDRGWVNAINVQGNVFTGDSYCVEDLPGGGVKVTQINDELRRWAGARIAREVTISPLGQDHTMGGAINTKAHQVVYADVEIQHKLGGVGNVTVRNWENFVQPPEPLLRYGLMLPNDLFAAHESFRGVRGWREWGDHLEPHELYGGKVRCQRQMGRYIVPDGTRTYYHDAADLPAGAYAATHENSLLLATGTPVTETSGSVGTNATLEWGAATPANEPGSAQWPTGNYRYQLDVPTANVDLVFGLLTLDTADGGFLRMDDVATILEQHPQQEAAFSLSGLHLATTGNVSWGAGGIGDRFGILIAADKVAGHGGGTFDLQLGQSDDFADGPWPAATGAENVSFFGANF